MSNPDERPQTRGAYRVDSWERTVAHHDGDWSSSRRSALVIARASCTTFQRPVSSEDVGIEGGPNDYERNARTKDVLRVKFRDQFTPRNWLVRETRIDTVIQARQA